MMVMDVAIFHKTEGILDLLKSNNIVKGHAGRGIRWFRVTNSLY
jgi:hypothetical protein